MTITNETNLNSPLTSLLEVIFNRKILIFECANLCFYSFLFCPAWEKNNKRLIKHYKMFLCCLDYHDQPLSSTLHTHFWKKMKFLFWSFIMVSTQIIIMGHSAATRYNIIIIIVYLERLINLHSHEIFLSVYYQSISLVTTDRSWLTVPFLKRIFFLWLRNLYQVEIFSLERNVKLSWPIIL